MGETKRGEVESPKERTDILKDRAGDTGNEHKFTAQQLEHSPTISTFKSFNIDPNKYLDRATRKELEILDPSTSRYQELLQTAKDNLASGTTFS